MQIAYSCELCHATLGTVPDGLEITADTRAPHQGQQSRQAIALSATGQFGLTDRPTADSADRRQYSCAPLRATRMPGGRTSVNDHNRGLSGVNSTWASTIPLATTVPSRPNQSRDRPAA
jgi:hypothetical protein